MSTKKNQKGALPPFSPAARLWASKMGTAAARGRSVHVARYYFNLFNDEITIDEEGCAFPDLAAAMARALVETRALAAESVRHGHFVRSHYVEVVDEDRRRVGVVRFDEAVRIE